MASSQLALLLWLLQGKLIWNSESRRVFNVGFSIVRREEKARAGGIYILFWEYILVLEACNSSVQFV